MKYAVYCRVSKIDQHPENQELELRRYLKNRGIKDFDLFHEKETTRKTRPIKENILKECRKAKYQGIIIWSLFRWARTLEELISDLNQLVNCKVSFTSICDLGEIDISTAYGKLAVQVLGAFGEFERERIRERTMLGLERAKSEGKQLGRPKGSMDKKKRRTSGYNLRWSGDSK
jgi:DNA invertase Pin-like site-specific DNA recombinase